MFIEDITKRIEELALEFCQKTGMVLVSSKVSGSANNFHIQITADKSGGITVGECALLHKALVAAIYEENLLAPGSFSMEVASPGLE